MVNRWFNPPAAVRLLDGRVLVTGESVGSDVPTKAAELYDPSTGTWSATGSKIQILGNQPLLLLTDGKVLAFDGGYSPELYDPATGSWTMAPSTGHDPGQKVGGPSPLLTDGKVLNIGFPGDPASWLYAPATGSWTQTAAMLADTGGSYQNAATVLLDGTVLVAGGSVCSAVQGCPNGPDGALAGAQRYIPASASLPTGLAAVPAPTPTPTPAPTPTPFPPMAGPVPQGARPWEVTVENRSSRPATLFLATEPLTDMGQLCGSITPDVVPAHTTEKVTFQLPPKSVNDCWLMVRPGPGASGDHGPTNEWPIPGKLVIEDGGDNANGDDLSVLWQGP
jgi:hypothetical protein